MGVDLGVVRGRAKQLTWHVRWKERRCISLKQSLDRRSARSTLKSNGLTGLDDAKGLERALPPPGCYHPRRPQQRAQNAGIMSSDWTTI